MDWWSRFGPGATRRARGRFMAVLAALALTGMAGIFVGYELEKHNVPYTVRSRLTALFHRRQATIPIEWTRKLTTYHLLDVAHVKLGRAWSLEEIEGNVVFATRLGRLGYLTPEMRAASLGLDAPMRFEALQRSSLYHDDLFEVSRFRTTDLLSVETGPHQYDLYAAHQRFEGDCFRIVVSRAHLRGGAGGLRAASQNWDQIYQSRDCIRPKARGFFFAGDQGGGRLVRLNNDTLALSIGDFQFNGVDTERAVSMDPNSDLGKIIAISLTTGRARVLASGLRNPQGLLVSRAGQLWETEHGPRGGDELNRIRPGANYGWPMATYGMRYASRPVNWPLDPVAGSHAGYEPPVFAFLPSVAISNLIEPDPREFPSWSHHLLIASLKAQTVFLAGFEGDRVAYVEPIQFQMGRIRDIISLHDGRFAFATDNGDIILVSNADHARGQPRPTVLSGLEALGPARPEETLDVSSPERWGALAFGLYCSQCHTVTGEVRVGPSLDGLMGRRVGGAAGYAYSDALTRRSDVWTRDRLRQFLIDPQSVYPGTAMPSPNVSDPDLHDIVEYLAATRARAPSQGSP
jgi:cytochrome c2